LEADEQQLKKHGSNTGQNKVVSQRSSPVKAVKVVHKPKEGCRAKQD
jgi:hypothetical protein